MSKLNASREKPDAKLKELLGALNKLVAEFPPAAQQLVSGAGPTSKRTIAALLAELGAAAEAIVKVSHKLDPVRRPSAVFDPSNPGIVGRMIALTLTAQERLPLEEINAFYGSGIYAIYYNGGFEPYSQLVRTEHPIYVGKADPADPKAGNPVEQGAKLYTRLYEHLKSIKQTTLKAEDFDARHLVVASGWQAAAENYLIRLTRPIWNSQVDIAFGLGKHGDAATTRKNKRSPWDTLHPGRPWAANSEKDQKPLQKILLQLTSYFDSHTIYKTREDIFNEFMLEMSQLPKVTSEPPPPEMSEEDQDEDPAPGRTDLLPLPTTTDTGKQTDVL